MPEGNSQISHEIKTLPPCPPFMGEKIRGYSVLVPSAKYGLNEPNWYVPVLFVHRQQIVCHADHISGSDLDLQRL